MISYARTQPRSPLARVLSYACSYARTPVSYAYRYARPYAPTLGQTAAGVGVTVAMTEVLADFRPGLIGPYLGLCTVSYGIGLVLQEGSLKAAVEDWWYREAPEPTDAPEAAWTGPRAITDGAIVCDVCEAAPAVRGLIRDGQTEVTAVCEACTPGPVAAPAAGSDTAAASSGAGQ